MPGAVKVDVTPHPLVASGRWPRLKLRLETGLNRLIVSRLWPWPWRAVMIGLLVVLSYFALFGPRDPRLNFSTVFSWIIWWPLLAVSYFLFGRVWCAVCPMGALADLTQRFSLNLKAPRLFKRRGSVAGILLVMTEPWTALREMAAGSAILSNDAVFYGGLLMGFAGLAVGLFLAATKIFSVMGAVAYTVETRRFGFAFLPLALFAHIGHNLGHLLGGYQLIPAAVAASFGAPVQVPAGDAMLGLAVWRGLQFVLLGVGVALSVWALRRLCAASSSRCPSGRRLLPYAILTAVFALGFAEILSLPMTSRL